MVVKESAGQKYTNTTSKNGEKNKELKEIVTGKYDGTELESRGRKTEFEVPDLQDKIYLRRRMNQNGWIDG